MKYKAVIWDFDGVWSKDKFYKTVERDYPKIRDFIQNYIWGESGENRVERWMRAELNMNEINKLISENTGIDFELLTEKFLNDVNKMKIEMGHVAIINKLKKQNVKVALVTNNMEIFTSITRPRLKFDELFENKVFNSFDYKMLKDEGLFDLALKEMGNLNYADVILIDDSPRARIFFELKGGQSYAYNNFENFKIWAENNLLNK
jgi:FMN phosphatase YigB (HAD superfamily)